MTMIRETLNALAACVVTFALCAVAYPATVWALGQVAFPDQAEGSLVRDRERNVIGSSLVAQPFASDKYFAPRPSAVDYNASATGGSNLGTKNPDLHKKIGERAEALKATAEAPAPVDLVTASGGGLDPHISPEAARYQAARVAAARNLPLERIRELIEQHTDRSGAIIGAPPRVNVLMLNIALDEEKPTPSSAVAAGPVVPEAAPAASPSTPEPAPAQPVADPPKSTVPPPPAVDAKTQAEVEALSARLDRLQAKFEAAPVDRLADELKDVKVRLAGLVESPAVPAELARKLDNANQRIAAYDRDLEALRAEVKALRSSNRVDAVVTDTAKPVEAARPAETSNDLDVARSLFRAKRYAEAAEAFRLLTASRPDDARAWYFAGLTKGLATRLWRGEAEQLALKGVEREKAGTPAIAEINDAFSDLTPETGRDWLAFFRKRAATP
jgi:K+-transporting ATPase ATPase C chain